MIKASALRRCRDYLVDSPDGQVGTVADIRYAPGSDMPTALAIRAGRAGSLILIVPISQLTTIRPARHLVTLRPSPEITTTERAC